MIGDDLQLAGVGSQDCLAEQDLEPKDNAETIAKQAEPDSSSAREPNHDPTRTEN